jgi:predicted nucleotidyltransferase component of viral defense system
MLTRDQLLRAASENGFGPDALEKVWMLLGLLNSIAVHPFIGPRVALKGGTALNLFVFNMPRLSVDIDINYIGAEDRATMAAERPRLDTALVQVASRLGLGIKRAPDEHAGGKWRMSYTSVLGRPATLEVDINYMLRVPLWEPTYRESSEFLGERAKRIRVLNDHELVAGKLSALLSRGAIRDIFDARQVLKTRLDPEMLRLAFVVYGGINRVDWRGVSPDLVSANAEDVRRQLLPTLHRDLRPEVSDVESWTKTLVEETRSLLGIVFPLAEEELQFLERLNGHGEIEPSLLTSDSGMQHRISSNPGLKWKALNVKKHIGKREE